MYAWIFHILEDFHIIYHITCKNQSDLKINKVGFFLKYFFLLDCLTKKKNTCNWDKATIREYMNNNQISRMLYNKTTPLA